MKLPIYQIDAFTGAVFGGNPAAVVPLESWLPDATLQAIAMENNLSETAYFVPEGEGWRLRWFTPTMEVDLCGHATLASAHLIFFRLKTELGVVRFETRSGILEVAREGELLTMNFPAMRPARVEDGGKLRDALGAALGRTPREVWRARDLMAVFDQAEDVRTLKPDMTALARVEAFAVLATAPGTGGVDFVSRFFAPARGVPEDPVTGSAHCELTPFWADRLGRKRLTARQVSARGGELLCEDRGERVAIAGRAVLYLEGTILV